MLKNLKSKKIFKFKLKHFFTENAKSEKVKLYIQYENE